MKTLSESNADLMQLQQLRDAISHAHSDLEAAYIAHDQKEQSVPDAYYTFLYNTKNNLLQVYTLNKHDSTPSKFQDEKQRCLTEAEMVIHSIDEFIKGNGLDYTRPTPEFQVGVDWRNTLYQENFPRLVPQSAAAAVIAPSALPQVEAIQQNDNLELRLMMQNLGSQMQIQAAELARVTRLIQDAREPNIYVTPPHVNQLHGNGHFAPIIQPSVLPQSIYGRHSVSEQPAHALSSPPVYQSMQLQYHLGAESPYNH
jgi:hypothetical protein